MILRQNRGFMPIGREKLGIGRIYLNHVFIEYTFALVTNKKTDMQKLILSTLLMISIISANAQEKITLTLSEAIEMGISQNFDQQILDITLLSTQESLAQSKRDLLPEFNAQLSQGISNINTNGNYSINASATLWSGGMKMNTIRRSTLELTKADEQIIAAQNNLAISIINTYLLAVMNEDLYRYQEKVYEISKVQAVLGESKYKAGDILESEYLLLKAQAASDANSLINSKIERDNAIVELKNLLVIDHTIELNVSNLQEDITIDKMPLPSLDELINITMEWLPELKMAEYSLEIANKDVDIAKGARMPTLSLNGSLGTTYNNTYNQNWSNQVCNNNVNSVSLTLSIPLWNKGKTNSNIKQAEYVAEQVAIEKEKTEFELRNQLEKEYNNTLALEQRTNATKESWQAYEETFRVFSAQFTEGAISTTDLLQQQNNYISALNNYMQSKYNYILSRKVLDVYMGVQIEL